MTEKRFTIDSDGKYWDKINQKYVTIDYLMDLSNYLIKENEQLKDEVYDEMDDALSVLVELYEYVPFDSRKKMNRLYNRLKSLRDDMND